MKLIATITFFGALVAAAPVVDRIEARLVTSSARSSSAVVVAKTSTPIATVTSKASSAVVAVSSKTSSAVVVVSSKASSTPIAMVSSRASSVVVAVSSKASSAVVVVSSQPSSAVAMVTSKASSASVASSTAAALLGVNVGGSSSPLVGVKVSSSTLLAVAVDAGTTSSVQASTITAAPTTSATTASTALPSTFSAPVQGQGVLTLDNLPAMPPVIDKTFSGVLGSVYGLMSGACNAQYQCNITVAGSISNLLIDGTNYNTASSVAAWCDAGRCYGSANAPLTATAPFIITCDQLSGTQACSATISGAANAIFTNGHSLELWGWLTPAGYCQNGVCTASITAVGDPMY